jgi:hypothetical protein
MHLPVAGDEFLAHARVPLRINDKAYRSTMPLATKTRQTLAVMEKIGWTTRRPLLCHLPAH